MSREPSLVLPRNKVLISIVLQNHKVGQATDKPYLLDFFFKAQKKDDAIVRTHINVIKVLLEVGLL